MGKGIEERGRDMEYTELRKKGVYLGRAGEDGKRTVWLDVTVWNEQAGGGSGVLLYTSPKGQVWPLGTKTETDEDAGTVKLSAPITLAETAAAGIGHIEAQWMSGGEKVKSQTFNTLVLESAYTGETVPDTAPHWVKELIEELNAAGMLLEELGEVASEAHGAYEEIRGTSALIDQALNTAEETVAQAQEYAEAAEGHAANADNYKDAAAASATAAAASAEQAMDATPDGYAAFVGSMAGAYSTASGYAVGDYVLKDGQLYKCNTAIDEEGETWTAAHWTAVTAAGQLSQLSEEINPLLGRTEIESGWTNGYYINDSGVVTEANYLRYSDAIQVESNTVYALSGKRTGGASNVRVYGYSSTSLDDKVQSLYSLSRSADYDITFNTRDATYIRISVLITDTNIVLTNTAANVGTQIEKLDTYSKGIGVEYADWNVNKGITTNVSEGAYVDTSLNAVTGLDCQMVKCAKGDIFFYGGLGAGAAMAWAFVDDECYLLSKTTDTFRYNEYLLTAPADGWIIVNAYSTYDGQERTHRLIKIYDASKTITALNAQYRQIVPPSMPEIFETVNTLPYNPNSLNWQSGDPSTPKFKGAYDRVIAGYDALVTQRVISFPNNGQYISQDGTIVNEPAMKYSEAIKVDRNTTYTFKGFYSATAYNFRIHGYSSANIADWNEQISSTLISSDYSITFNSGDNDYVRINMTVANTNPTVLILGRPNGSYQIIKSFMGYDQSGEIRMYRYDFIPALPTTNSDVDYAQKHTYTTDNFPVCIVNSGIHGDEKPDVYALLNLMTMIATAKDNSIFGWLRENIHFVVVPFENPYGFQYDVRGNVRHVDLNRNFPVYWELDPNADRDDPTSSRYRGESAGSEAETQYIISILNEFKNKALLYYSWHTHGVFTSFEKMTCYHIPKSQYYDMSQNVGYALIKSITNEGWKNHELDTDSGFIGIVEMSGTAGIACNTGVSYGIPSACPECMYRYYDGGSGAVLLNNDINCMNVEYMLYSIGLMIKAMLY